MNRELCHFNPHQKVEDVIIAASIVWRKEKLKIFGHAVNQLKGNSKKVSSILGIRTLFKSESGWSSPVLERVVDFCRGIEFKEHDRVLH